MDRRDRQRRDRQRRDRQWRDRREGQAKEGQAKEGQEGQAKEGQAKEGQAKEGQRGRGQGCRNRDMRSILPYHRLRDILDGGGRWVALEAKLTDKSWGGKIGDIQAVVVVIVPVCHIMIQMHLSYEEKNG